MNTITWAWKPKLKYEIKDLNIKSEPGSSVQQNLGMNTKTCLWNRTWLFCPKQLEHGWEYILGVRKPRLDILFNRTWVWTSLLGYESKKFEYENHAWISCPPARPFLSSFSSGLWNLLIKLNYMYYAKYNGMLWKQDCNIYSTIGG